MATARTHCPECNSHAVIDLAEALPHGKVDFFWCGMCCSMWHLPKGKSWPPSKTLLQAADTEPATRPSSPQATARRTPVRRPRRVRSRRETRPSPVSPH